MHLFMFLLVIWMSFRENVYSGPLSLFIQLILILFTFGFEFYNFFIYLNISPLADIPFANTFPIKYVAFFNFVQKLFNDHVPF